MAKDSYCEHLADGKHTLLLVVAYGGHCLLPVLGDGNTRLAKDSKKQLVQKSGKVWFDNAMHDPLDLASSLLLVTLFPLVQQGPHNGLLRVLYDTAHF